MSLEDDASSWVVSLFDSLESPENRKVRVLAAAGAIVVLIILWLVHLSRPEIFMFFLEQRGWGKAILGVLLAPPFVVAFTVGTFIYPRSIEPVTNNETGPMSTYFYQEGATRRWKLLIGAGIIAALNFMLMVVTSGL